MLLITLFREVKIDNDDPRSLVKTFVFMSWRIDVRKDVDVDVEQNMRVVDTCFDEVWYC